MSPPRAAGAPPTRREASDLARGAALHYLGMAARVSKVLFIAVASRGYGSTALGQYLLAWAVVELAAKLALGGIDRSLLHTVPRYDRADPHQSAVVRGLLGLHVLWALGLSLIAAAAVLLSSDLVARGIFGQPELAAVLRLLALAVPSVVLSQTLVAATRALRTMKYDFLIRQCLEPLMLLVATLAWLPLRADGIGLAAAHLVASLTAVVAAAAAARASYRHIGWRLRSPRAPVPSGVSREVVHYLSPFAALTVCQAVAAKADLMIVGAVVGAAAAGSYGVAVEIISVVKRGGQNFVPMFQPIVAELYYSRERERLQRTYVLVTRWIVATTLLPWLAVTIYREPLLYLFATHEPSMPLSLALLALGFAFSGSFGAADTLLLMTGRSVLSASLAGLSLLLTGGVALLLVPVVGVWGAAFAVLSAQTAVTSLRLVMVQRLHGLRPFGRELLWPLVTTGVTAGVFGGLQALAPVESLAGVVTAIALLAVSYAGLFILGAVEPEEEHLRGRVADHWRRLRAVRPHRSPPGGAGGSSTSHRVWGPP